MTTLGAVCLPQVPPVLAGAIGPRTLRLSGQAADGTILVAGTGPDGVRRARDLIAEGQAASGRTGGHRLVVYLEVADRGDAARTAAAVRDLAEAGAEADPEGFVRFAADQVRPPL